MQFRQGRWQMCFLALVLAAQRVPAAETKPLAFHITFSESVCKQPFTGRVFVMLSAQPIREVPSGPNWFRPEPFFAKDVKDWRPGQEIVLGDDALNYPAPLTKLSAGMYYLQAIMDFDRGERSFAAADGNGYSRPISQRLEPQGGPVSLFIDQVYKSKPFQETERIKLADVDSKLLSEFEGRRVRLRAAVILPKSFTDHPERRYPAIYVIPGFGGNHRFAQFLLPRNPTDVASVEMLYVVLDPDCRWGHHVFADSKNNGPCGQALVEELIPHVEKRFRAIGVPQARFVTGHSSGGWSSLWLQVAYPDFFGGVWSTSPDPLDFRDFQRINIYKLGGNMFTDESGRPRPLARTQDRPLLFYKPFSDMETVMGHGGQLQSFEAVFGPRGSDGKPKKLWDRTTGKIDPDVAKSWEKYDIRLVLERHWKTLGPKLKGKLHVYIGGDDNFYLEGAVLLLKESLAKLGSDAVVEIIPGKDHGTLLDKAMMDRIAQEMAAAFRAGIRSRG